MIINLRKFIEQKLKNYLDDYNVCQINIDFAEQIFVIESLSDFEVIDLYKKFLKINDEDKKVIQNLPNINLIIRSDNKILKRLTNYFCSTDIIIKPIEKFFLHNISNLQNKKNLAYLHVLLTTYGF